MQKNEVQEMCLNSNLIQSKSYGRQPIFCVAKINIYYFLKHHKIEIIENSIVK